MSDDRTLTDFFMDLFERHDHVRRGDWINMNCPLCGDTRKRLGMVTTETGGFRLSCFNGGCDLQIKAAGWEPGNPPYERLRSLYAALGGSWGDIPLKVRMPTQGRSHRISATIGAPKPRFKFQEIEYPPGTVNLWGDNVNDHILRAREYIHDRSPAFLELGIPLLWSEKYPEYVILPFLDSGGKLVGYVGRRTIQSGRIPRFVQSKPNGYLYGQHQVEPTGGYILVVESAFDAAITKSLGTLSAKITPTQVAIIKSLKRTPIVVPDQTDDNESTSFIETAKENGWLVSMPNWRYKDVGEAARDMGVINAVRELVNNATDNYLSVKLSLKLKHMKVG